MIGKFKMWYRSLTSAPYQKQSFTTQRDLLSEHDVLTHDNGEEIGMCLPMTNVYLDLLLKGDNPSRYLFDAQRFLNLSIVEENRELDAEKSGDQDIDHCAFSNNGVAHEHETLARESFTPAAILKRLERKPNILMQFPVQGSGNPEARQLKHQVFIGRVRSNCRFFDANMQGGERIAPCKELADFVLTYLDNAYPDRGKVSLGMG